MLKKFSKFLLLFLLVFVISSSSFLCLASETQEVSNTTATGTNTENSATNSENSDKKPETHTGDLYLFGYDVVMDKIVDGNVFIFGNNVEITGNVNGNLFVFANNVRFNECTIMYSIFACSNYVYYNGGCYYGDLYVSGNTIDMTYNSYVSRDIKAIGSDINFKAAVGRDVDLICDNLNIGEGKDTPIIYGNFRYTANKEISIPEGIIVSGDSATYTKSTLVIDIILSFLTCIITTLAIYAILNKLTPSFIKNISKESFSFINILKCFGLGLATVIVFVLLFAVLSATVIGFKIAIIFALLFAILYIISVPALVISITNKLKHVLKLEKTSMFYLMLSLVSIVLYGITLIPYAGIILGFVINATSIGLIINIYLPHKELTEEEKIVREEAKKLAKENKEKRKQEKLEAKESKKKEKLEAKTAKKQEKLEAKEAKKNDKGN